LRKKNNDFKLYDEEMAFYIFLVEKEFNVGPITEDFPLLKFLNLINVKNLNKYNEMMNKTSTSNETSKTFR
jgi:hypothetical protein